MAFFTFGSGSNAVTYEATSISVTTSGREVDSSHLGLGKGSLRKFRSLKMTNYEIKVDYLGDTAPAIGVDDFSIDSGWGATGSAFGTKAACTSVTITGTVGDQVKGSATFKPSYD
jgi:hypothetical protein